MRDPRPASSPAEAAKKRVGGRRGFLGGPPASARRQWRVFLIACTAGFFDNYDRALLGLALKQIQQGLRIAEDRLGAVLS